MISGIQNPSAANLAAAKQAQPAAAEPKAEEKKPNTAAAPAKADSVTISKAASATAQQLNAAIKGNPKDESTESLSQKLQESMLGKS